MKLSSKDIRTISFVLAIWGLLFIGSGYTMTIITEPVTVNKNKLEIIQKRVAQRKTNEIKLKELELEINTPLSLNIKDYLNNPEEIDDEIIKTLKLDTSTININEPGTYKYTVTFKKKKYIGQCTIKEKPLPKVEITLKNLKLPIGSSLSTDVATYIVGPLIDEVKNNIILDLSTISTTETGIYQYTVTYNNQLYTGTIEVYEPQTKVITPNKNEEKEENEVLNKDTNTEEEKKN